MTLRLGIDPGGTYTDAVLFSEMQGVVRSAKALTTRHDLSQGIRAAIEAVLPDPTPPIGLVSISTTLATNAIVEGQGAPICLLLLGYPPDALQRAGLGAAMGADPAVFLPGGHDVYGEEQEALDLEAARQAILAHAPHAEAFAVSGYFGVLNPSHELAVRDLVRQLTGKPVTCGHELTSNLHAPRRALTTALNARLIPFLEHLILAVQDTLHHKDIHAPLMVVKGDGSLMSAQVALERPVETILSGPAASAVGAHYLSGEAQVLVVDMGGTTTDIALLKNGRPALSVEGATVGAWQTMVEAIAAYTSGLGGDSAVSWSKHGELTIGPRRLVPLSLLAEQYPQVLEQLRKVARKNNLARHEGQFALRRRALETAFLMDNDLPTLESDQQDVWEVLAEGPVPLEELLGSGFQTSFRRRALDNLVQRGWVILSGFTPSDAAHVLGRQVSWNREAALLGATIWARQAVQYHHAPQLSAEDFSQRVLQQVIVQLGRAVVSAALAETHPVKIGQDVLMRHLFVDRAFSSNGHEDALVDVALTLRRPLVAIGAPVTTYFPALAERLHTHLTIPEHAAVANAVGAVVGSVAQSARAQIQALPDDTGYRLHLPNGVFDFDNLEQAAGKAQEETARLAEANALRAGADHVHVTVDRKDHIYRADDGTGEELYLGSEIIATAVGRPRLA